MFKKNYRNVAHYDLFCVLKNEDEDTRRCSVSISKSDGDHKIVAAAQHQRSD